MKIVFFGTSDFVAPVRDVLKDKFDLVASFTSPEQKIEKNELEKLNPDLFVVASFGKILKKEILDVPRYGALNLHPSLLPKYRGPSPVQSAILNGNEETGITIIKMDEKMDHGPILFQKKEKTNGDDTFEILAHRLFQIGANYLYQTIQQYIRGSLKPVSQDESKATFTKLISKSDGQIQLANPPVNEKLDRMIKAYFPWPGIWFKTKIGGADKILKLLPSQKIQVEGKNPMSYKDFENGYSEGKETLKKLNQS